jgi:membrane-bound lytic murein transglycosylase D
MDLVWEVVELPLQDSGRVDETAAGALIRSRVEELRERLQRLARETTPSDDEDKVLWVLAGGNPDRFRDAASRLRTQRGVADRFLAGWNRAQNWLQDVQAILAAEGVPTEVAVLPFVESMFNPDARSHVGAAGLWQLMPATARELGLRVDRRGNDERLDVHKATRAAARLLRSNYKKLGSWPLAITAYNHGPNGVQRAVDQVGSTDLITLINEYEQATWGFASKNFYAEFLACRQIAEKHGLFAVASTLPDELPGADPSVRN